MRIDLHDNKNYSPAHKTAKFDLVEKHRAKVLEIRVEGRSNREDRKGSIVIPCFTFAIA